MVEISRVRFEHRSVRTADGVAIPVVETGRKDGPPVVFVHGLASSSAAWSAVMRDRRLSENYRLIAFDLRGHGTSAQSLSTAQMNVSDADAAEQTWSRDLDAVIAELDSAYLVGWSFGCRVIGGWMHKHGGLQKASGAAFISGPSVLKPLPIGDPAAAILQPGAGQILARAADGGHARYSELIMTTGNQGAPLTPDRERIAEIASITNPDVVKAALASAFDYRQFLSTLTDMQRDRLFAIIPRGDRVFQAEATRASWDQAEVSVSIVEGQPHAWPLADPQNFVASISTLLRRIA